MAYKEILYEVKDGVARITLNRPEELNRFTPQTHKENLAALQEAAADPSVGVVLLTGAGEAFSLGGDIRGHLERPAAWLRPHLGVLAMISVVMRTMGKPIVAAVNGRCLGAALQLQLLCDLSIASERATFGLTACRRGAIPEFWGTHLLPLAVGERKAREMCFLCREYPAEEALGMGLVNHVVPHGELDGEAERWCRELLSMSPGSLRIVKASLNHASDLCYSGIWQGREMVGFFAGSEERRVGAEAFVAGRRADYSPFRSKEAAGGAFVPPPPRAYTDILYEKREGVATITLNRPERENALTTHSYEEVLDAARRAEADPEVGAVVVTGAGEAFSVGGEQRAHVGRSPASLRLHLRTLMLIAVALRTMGKPAIAAVNGKCIGGANQLHLLCDLSIASERAVFGQHGTKRGAVPVFWGTQLLPRLVGERKAREVCYLSREYSAREALEMGLVNKVVPHGELKAEVDLWCHEILGMSPTALAMAKTSLNYGSDLCYPAVWHARELATFIQGTEEKQAGQRAFVEGKGVDWSRFRA